MRSGAILPVVLIAAAAALTAWTLWPTDSQRLPSESVQPPTAAPTTPPALVPLPASVPSVPGELATTWRGRLAAASEAWTTGPARLVDELVALDAAASVVSHAELAAAIPIALGEGDPKVAFAMLAVLAKHVEREALDAVLDSSRSANVLIAALLVAARTPPISRAPSDHDFWGGLLLDPGAAPLFASGASRLRNSTPRTGVGVWSFSTRRRAIRPVVSRALVVRIVEARGDTRARERAVHLYPPGAPDALQVWIDIQDRDELPPGPRVVAMWAAAGHDYAGQEPRLERMYSEDRDEAVRVAALQVLVRAYASGTGLRGTEWWKLELRKLVADERAPELEALVSGLPAKKLGEFWSLLVMIACEPRDTLRAARPAALGKLALAASRNDVPANGWAALKARGVHLDASGKEDIRKALTSHAPPGALDWLR